MSAAERCQRWPEHDRCCFAGLGGVTCVTCERFDSHAQALEALARHRLLLLVGAEQAEEEHRGRVVRQLAREAGASALLASALLDIDSVLNSAHAHAMVRCWDVLRLQLGEAILAHGAHALELETAWLREWAERQQRARLQAGGEALHG